MEITNQPTNQPLSHFEAGIISEQRLKAYKKLHLSQPTVNSKFHSSRQGDVKLSEVFRIYSMTSDELQEEVKYWH